MQERLQKSLLHSNIMSGKLRTDQSEKNSGRNRLKVILFSEKTIISDYTSATYYNNYHHENTRTSLNSAALRSFAAHSASFSTVTATMVQQATSHGPEFPSSVQTS